MPVLYQASQLGGAPPTEGQRRFILSDEVFAGVAEAVRAAGRGQSRLADRHRAALAARRHAGGARSRRRARPLARSGDAGPHPCRRAGEGGRGLPRLVGQAAGRVAARPWRRARLVPHPLHPHDRGRAPPPRRERRRRRPLPDDGSQSRRRLLSDPRFRGRGRERSASAPIPTSRPARSRNCAGSNMAAGCSAAPATSSRRGSAPRSAPRWSRAPSPAAPRRSAGRSARSSLAGAPISWCSIPSHPALVGRPLERVLDAFVFNGNETPVTRRDGRRTLGGARIACTSPKPRSGPPSPRR